MFAFLCVCVKEAVALPAQLATTGSHPPPTLSCFSPPVYFFHSSLVSAYLAVVAPPPFHHCSLAFVWPLLAKRAPSCVFVVLFGNNKTGLQHPLPVKNSSIFLFEILLCFFLPKCSSVLDKVDYGADSALQPFLGQNTDAQILFHPYKHHRLFYCFRRRRHPSPPFCFDQVTSVTPCSRTIHPPI